MSSEKFGLTAEGLCFGPMFAHGVPGTNIIESFIDRIDHHLGENSRQLEECMREILELSNELTEGEKKVTDPVEGITYIKDARILDRNMCHDPNLDVVVQSLRHAIKSIESNPGCEDAVLQSLLSLSSVEGIMLPSCSTSTLTSESVLSLHSTIDQSEHAVESLWNDLCHRLRRHYLDKLNRMSTVNSVSASSGLEPVILSTCRDERLACVQSLCSLFPRSSVLVRYHGIRQAQFELCLDSHCKRSGAEKQTFHGAITDFIVAMNDVLYMMKQDLDLFNSGVFHDVGDSFTNISEIYFDGLERQLGSLVDRLHSDLMQADGLKEKISKSPSDVNFLSRRRYEESTTTNRSLHRQSSKSLENVAGGGGTTVSGEQKFTDIRFISDNVFDDILRLVSCLLQIESYIESLHSAATWQTATVRHANTRRPKRLKSALKTSLNTDTVAENKNETKSRVGRGKKFSVSEIVKQIQTDAPPETLTSSDVVQGVTYGGSQDGTVFEWRGTFHCFATDMALYVSQSIVSAAEKSHKEELDNFNSSFSLIALAVLHGDDLNEPKQVSMATWKIVNELDRLLPLALAGVGGPLAPVRASFCGTVTAVLKTVYTWFIKLSLDRSTSLDIRSRYVMLASLSLILNRVQQYESALKIPDSSQPSFTEVLTELIESMDKVIQSILDEHNRQFFACILHDAESHRWNDSKEFFEGERCSFDVQMWNYTMQCIRVDLWSICSPVHARRIFANVLELSLSQYAWRYARVAPSQCRNKQFIGDISAILLCTSEMLLYACDSISQFLDPCEAHKLTYSIHNSCSNLIAALAVIGSPLDVIFKIFRKGFSKRLTVPEDDYKGYLSQWISWLRPAFISRGKLRYEDLSSNVAIFLQISLLHQQPSTDYHHLLHAMLMKQCSLPILLLSHITDAHYIQKVHQAKNESIISTHELFAAMFNVLLRCHQFPTALSKVLVSSMERSNDWNFFSDNNLVEESNKSSNMLVPAILKELKSFLVRVADPGIRLLITKLEKPTSSISPMPHLNAKLPCGCQPVGPTSDVPENPFIRIVGELLCHAFSALNSHSIGDKDLLAECMYSVITQLVEDIFAIPLPIVILFRMLQDKLTEKRIKTPFNCIGIKILASGLRQILSDMEHIEKLISYQPTSVLHDNLLILSECVYHLLTSTSFDKASTAPRAAGLFMKANKSWIQEQLESVTDYLNNPKFESVHDDALEDFGKAEEYLEELLIQQADAIIDSYTGKCALSMIYDFVWNNHNWIVLQLNVAPLYAGKPMTDSDTKLNFEAKRIVSTHLNPLALYNRIGVDNFDHSLMMNWSYDWSTMLQSDLGLSLLSFRNLLRQRSDMQDDAYLDDSDKRMVEALRRKYEPESD